MSLTLFAHPFSSYCWKVLIALYEDKTPFTYRRVEDAEGWAALKTLWPIKKFPLLQDGEKVIVESSVIVEYLMLHKTNATRWIPANSDLALQVRFMDRFFDNYVMTPMSKIVLDCMRGEHEKDTKGVAEAREMLATAYAWLDSQLSSSSNWAVGNMFTLADCSAAPALFYADWVQPIGGSFPNVQAYRKQLLSHSSVARVVDEARPYRHFFPPGAPDRD